jgi:hypothetical protein
VPRLYASCHQPALLLMQDLKPVAHLGTFLQGRDAQQAAEALMQWGAALGKLHASTIGKQMAFNTLREALAPRTASWSWVPPWQRASNIYDHLVSCVPAPLREQGFESFQWMLWTLRQTCEALSLPCTIQMETELAEVIRALSSPGPFPDLHARRSLF